MSKPPFGPMSADEFQKAVDAPFGMAASMLRKHDPLWGKTGAGDGEPVRWKVRLEKTTRLRATTYVEAATEEQAELLAAAVDGSGLDWDDIGDDDDGEVVDVERAP